MALNVYTSKCKQDAAIRKHSHIQYNLGVIMMVLGVDEVTDANLTETLCRFEFYASIENFTKDEKETYREWFKDSVGVQTNVNKYTWNQFVKHMGDNYKRRYVYA